MEQFINKIRFNKISIVNINMQNLFYQITNSQVLYLNRAQTISIITGEESVFCLPTFCSSFIDSSFSYGYYIFIVCCLDILVWNLIPSQVKMPAKNIPAFSTTVSPNSLPSNFCHHPFCYTCSTPFGLYVFPPDFVCVLLLPI